MSPSTITLLFLLFAVIMFVFEKIPLGVTSMIVCIGLVVTGVLDVKTAFAGFIDSNVILFVSMFIVGGALFETGMANKIGSIVTRFAKSERMLIVAIMVIVGFMSGVLSNTGTAAVLIPVVIGIAAKSGYKRSRLLMPLVFAAAMGGNLSLIGAPGNLIANKVIGELGENPSPYVLTFVVFILCCILTNFMSNTATTALMVPICLSIAQGMGADPRAVLMACVIGGSCAYAAPISAEDLKDIHAGDIVYLNGSMTTCRDVAHRRLVEEGRELPVNVRDAAIFHAGPIIRPLENDKFEMVSVGPTTSMRMEKFEYEFVRETGVRVIIGKGGMKENTERACKEFGPLIVSIDTEGRNLFEENKVIFNQRKDKAVEEICKHVSFIK